MDPEEQAKMDQDFAKLREGLAGMVWAFYSGLVDKGFTYEQALGLTHTYVLGLGGGKYKI